MYSVIMADYALVPCCYTRLLTFQIELLELLAGLLLSLILNQATPFFIVSALCSLASTIALASGLLSNTAGVADLPELAATCLLATMLIVGVLTVLIARWSLAVVRGYAMAALASSGALAVKAAYILAKQHDLGHHDVREQRATDSGHG